MNYDDFFGQQGKAPKPVVDTSKYRRWPSGDQCIKAYERKGIRVLVEKDVTDTEGRVYMEFDDEMDARGRGEMTRADLLMLGWVLTTLGSMMPIKK